MVPSDKRLQKQDVAALQGDGRLVVKEEFMVLHGMLEIHIELHPVEGGRPQRRFVALVSRLASGLGHVEGHVRVAQQLVGGLAGRRQAGNPDANPDKELLLLEEEGRPKVPQDALGHARGRLIILKVLEEDGELVAAQPGHDVDRLDQALESGADGRQQLVAGFVTQAVVD